MKDMPEVYCVRADFGRYATQFVAGGYVAIGWLERNNLSKIDSKEQLYPLYKKANPTHTSNIVIGIQVHMGNIWLYFFKAVKGDDSYKFRDDLFGWANYAGFVAGLIVLVLLLLSNDLSLKWLRPRRWKNIQRWNYLLFALVLMHGIMYQIIEKRTMVIILLFSMIMLMPVIGQSLGFSIARKNK